MYVALGTVRRKGRTGREVRVDDGSAPRTPQPLRIEVLGNPDSGMQGSAEVNAELLEEGPVVEVALDREQS